MGESILVWESDNLDSNPHPSSHQLSDLVSRPQFSTFLKRESWKKTVVFKCILRGMNMLILAALLRDQNRVGWAAVRVRLAKELQALSLYPLDQSEQLQQQWPSALRWVQTFFIDVILFCLSDLHLNSSCFSRARSNFIFIETLVRPFQIPERFCFESFENLVGVPNAPTTQHSVLCPLYFCLLQCIAFPNRQTDTIMVLL